MTECQSCGAAIKFVNLLTTEGGRRHPVDLVPLGAVAVGCIAVRPGTGHAVVVSRERLQTRPHELMSGEADFHTSHFATCPHAERHRGVSRDQLGLDV
jgi:hypothetical protein